MVNYFLFSLFLGGLFFATGFRREMLKLTAIISIIVVIIMYFISYLAMPTMSAWGFDGVYIMTFITAVLALIFSALSEDYLEINSTTKYRAIPLIILLLMGVPRCTTSSSMFNSKELHRQLEVVELAPEEFVGDVHPIPVEKMINVNQSYAHMLASNRIEEISSLGSRAQFERPTLINLNGEFEVTQANGTTQTLRFDNEQVWVSALQHLGFWKWSSYGATQGYAIVSANDPGKSWFVTKINGKPIELVYLPSAFFGENIKRYIRNNGYIGVGLTDFSFELDDAGNPFYVVTTYMPEVGFSGDNATGVLVVDPQNGKITDYSVEEAPEWIDRIQPEDIVRSQIKNWGLYVRGWRNSLGKALDVKQATRGMSVVYSNGKCYYYTGIQSVGADRATSGFMLIDTRTKETILYKVSGINENLAQEIIQDNSEWVRMAKFMANPPVLYNVHGKPSYYMTLSADGVKVAGYAFVSLESDQIFAAASTPQKALADYFKAIQSSGQFQLSDGEVEEAKTQKATIRDIVFEDGIYYVIFEEIKGIEFMGSSEAFIELKWSKIGNKVEVTFQESETNKVPIDKFENLDFSL